MRAGTVRRFRMENTVRFNLSKKWYKQTLKGDRYVQYPRFNVYRRVSMLCALGYYLAHRLDEPSPPDLRYLPSKHYSSPLKVSVVLLAWQWADLLVLRNTTQRLKV
jgi:hypothetical protein